MYKISDNFNFFIKISFSLKSQPRHQVRKHVKNAGPHIYFDIEFLEEIKSCL